MNVVILAAGTSRRLLPLTLQKPKAILPLFDGKSLLTRIVHNLAENQKFIHHVVIVGGHGYRHLQREVASLQHIFSSPVTLIYNPNYGRMNNCCSLAIGIKNALDDDVLIINSDVLYDTAILDKILKVPRTTMVVDNKKQLTAESMKVYVKNGNITDIGKHLDINKSYGEYIGIARIQKEHLQKLLAALDAIINQNPELFYEDAFRSILSDVPFGVVPTDGLLWTEIDDQRDLQVAQRIYRDLKSQ